MTSPDRPPRTPRIRAVIKPRAWVALLALNLGACAPALDWRDVRLEEGALRLQFPCRPDTQERQVALAGVAVKLRLRVCSAEDLTWGLVQADVEDPARVGPALAALQAGAAANIGARPVAVRNRAVPGATPQPGSGLSVLAGQRPDGVAVRMQTLVFAHGTQVYQASVLGADLPGAAVEVFFDSLQFRP